MAGLKRARSSCTLGAESSVAAVSSGPPQGAAAAAVGGTTRPAADARHEPTARRDDSGARGERTASDGDAASPAPRRRRGERRQQTDLRADTIEDLRAQHQQLRTAAREAQRHVRNAKKRRNRVLTRLRNIDTASVLAVLMDRMAPTTATPQQVEARMASAVADGLGPEGVESRMIRDLSARAAASPAPRSPEDSGSDAADAPSPVAEAAEREVPDEEADERAAVEASSDSE